MDLPHRRDGVREISRDRLARGFSRAARHHQRPDIPGGACWKQRGAEDLTTYCRKPLILNVGVFKERLYLCPEVVFDTQVRQ